MADRKSISIARLCEVRSPNGYGEVLNRHLPYLLATAPFLLAAYLLPRGMRIVPGCLFKRITGTPCMFCGYTTAFQNMARLDFAPALADNPAALVLFAFMFAVAAWNLAGLLFGKLLLPGPLLRIEHRRFAGTAIAIFFGLNWIYRIINGAH